MFQEEGEEIKDAAKAGILDLYLTKFWALKYATDAACTVLKVDQIVMAKRAGGPKAPSGGGGGGAGDDDE
jgi:T-complex protein 1 subunit theta